MGPGLLTALGFLSPKFLFCLAQTAFTDRNRSLGNLKLVFVVLEFQLADDPQAVKLMVRGKPLLRPPLDPLVTGNLLGELKDTFLCRAKLLGEKEGLTPGYADKPMGVGAQCLIGLHNRALKLRELQTQNGISGFDLISGMRQYFCHHSGPPGRQHPDPANWPQNPLAALCPFYSAKNGEQKRSDKQAAQAYQHRPTP